MKACARDGFAVLRIVPHGICRMPVGTTTSADLQAYVHIFSIFIRMAENLQEFMRPCCIYSNTSPAVQRGIGMPPLHPEGQEQYMF